MFLLSIAVIALQMALMQALAVTRYSHFSYLVISTALLGFGASGTFIYLLEKRILARVRFWFTLFFFAFTVSIPLCYLGAQNLPLDIRYLFHSADQLLLLLAYVLLILMPFFFGATLIGLMLTYFSKQVQSLYGVNLVGSGIGGIAVLGLMLLAPGAQLPVYLGGFGFLAYLVWSYGGRSAEGARDGMQRGSRRSRDGVLSGQGWPPSLASVTGLVVAAGVTAVWFFITPSIPVSQYKPLYRLQLLESQGDAEHLATRYGPRAQIDVYQSDVMHQTLFAGIQAEAMPPDQLSLLFDGTVAGSVFKTEKTEATRILDFTPQSMAYRLIEQPRVLLLGEADGVNIWLAKRFDPRSITVVQDNPQLLDMLTGELAEESGKIFLDPNVELVEQNPRHFLDTTQKSFDVIQFVGAEAMVSGTQGLHSLHENYMLTVEAFQAALRLVSDRGLVTITRGLQSPPRDNIKIFTTAVEALRRQGVDEPGRQLLVGRNYLAVNTLFSSRPLDKERIQSFQQVCRELSMDTEHYPGIVSSQIEQNNIIEGPEDKPYSYLHYAIKTILNGRENQFYRQWAYDVSPAHDNSPYFHNFFTWKSLPRFMEAYGQHWFARTELGYMVLVITFIEVSLIAFLLILLPLLITRGNIRSVPNKLVTILFFGAIGFAFMFLEMTFLQKFGKFLGDPLFSTACALTALLVFSGLGSSLQHRVHSDLFRRIRVATVVVIAVGVVYLLVLDPLLSLFADVATWMRFVITIGCLSPISFFMGFYFSSGMTALQPRSSQLTPFAWGVNGFASVAASPLAVILSTAMGFDQVMIVAFALYGVAGLSTVLWKL